MVSTVSPKAKSTPKKPIPSCGKAAASTAEPHPPRTSQAVPMNSAASLRVKNASRVWSWGQLTPGTAPRLWALVDWLCDIDQGRKCAARLADRFGPHPANQFGVDDLA